MKRARPAMLPTTLPAIVPGGVDSDVELSGSEHGLVCFALGVAATRFRVFVVVIDVDRVLLVTVGTVAEG